MKLESITSLFELTCVFNFAYAVLHRSKTNQTFSNMFDVVDWIKSIHSDSTKKLKKELEKLKLRIEGEPENQKLAIINKKLEKYYGLFDKALKQTSIYDEYDEDFVHISLFLAFYSINVLFLSASESTTLYITLLSVMTLYTLLFSLLFSTKKMFNKVERRMKYLMTVLFSGLISITAFFFHYLAKNCPYILPHDYITGIVLISFIFSIIHFVLYFVQVVMNILFLKIKKLQYSITIMVHRAFHGQI